MDTNLLASPAISAILDPLTTKERTFVICSTIGLQSKAAAAKEAGYSRPPTKKRIRIAVNVIQDMMMEELEITKEDVQRGIMEAIGVGRVKQEGMTMLAGWRDMAKLLGYIDNKPAVGEVNLTQVNFGDMSELSVAQLRELAAPVLKKTGGELSSAREFIEGETA